MIRRLLAVTVFLGVLCAPVAQASRTDRMVPRIVQCQTRLFKVWLQTRTMTMEALACGRPDLAAELQQCRDLTFFASMHLANAKRLAERTPAR